MKGSQWILNTQETHPNWPQGGLSLFSFLSIFFGDQFPHSSQSFTRAQVQFLQLYMQKFQPDVQFFPVQVQFLQQMMQFFQPYFLTHAENRRVPLT